MKNRRQFIDMLVRGGILSVIAVVTGGLIHRWAGAGECRQDVACGHCGVSEKCRLPAADQYRLDKARMNPTKANHGNSGK